jgi:hypothetical protein
MKNILTKLANNKFVLYSILAYSFAARVLFEFGVPIGAFFVLSFKTASILFSLLILWQLVSYVILIKAQQENKKKVTVYFDNPTDAGKFESRLSHLRNMLRFDLGRNEDVTETIDDLKQTLEKSKMILNS